jgi:hypothetical protein
MVSSKTKREDVPVRVEKRRFNVHEYHRVAEVGILSEDDHVELIAGEVLEMSPIGSRHAACAGKLNRVLNRLAAPDAVVRLQDPIRLMSIRSRSPTWCWPNRATTSILGNIPNRATCSS